MHLVSAIHPLQLFSVTARLPIAVPQIWKVRLILSSLTILREAVIVRSHSSFLLSTVVTDLSYKLCAPVRGVNQGANLSGVLTSAGNGSTQPAPSPIAFTGGTAQMAMSTVTWMSVAILGLITGALVAW